MSDKNKQIKKFTLAIDELGEKMFDVFRMSLQDLIEDASKTHEEGGHMRVDTGFLRSSGVAAINQIPRGEIKGRKRNPGETGVLPEYADYSAGETASSVLQKLQPGETFYFGWTARYAPVREAYDGFVEAAVQKWPDFVKENKRSLKK